MNFLIKNSSKISLNEIWLSKTQTNGVFKSYFCISSNKNVTCQQKIMATKQ